MGIFDLGKKKEEAPKSTLPVDDVLRMKEKGFTNNQIVQALQRNGYKMHQVFDAMNQADLKSAGLVEGAVSPELAEQSLAQPIEQDTIPDLPNEQVAEEEPQQAVPQERYEEHIEEVAEAIIEEKWEDLMKSINKLLEWKEEMENKMASVEQSMKDLKENFSNLQRSVFGKVAEYDKSMKSVGADIQAMETVFQKVLPTLTDNVNELSRLTRKAKDKEKK